MTTKWILPTLTLLSLVACDKPKVTKFEFKAPNTDEILEQLRKQRPDETCEVVPSKIELKGAVEQITEEAKKVDPRLVTSGEVTLLGDVSKPATFVQKPGTTRQLINVGCDAETVKAYAQDLEVVEHKDKEAMVGDTVLLCQAPPKGALVVVAANVVLKDFKYLDMAGLSVISVNAGRLVLEGKNEISALAGDLMTVLGSVDLDPVTVSLAVDTGIEGTGTLHLSSAEIQCKPKTPTPETVSSVR